LCLSKRSISQHSLAHRSKGKTTTSKGSAVGQSSSSYKGNGDVNGGNGTYAASHPGSDQTTGPHSLPTLLKATSPAATTLAATATTATNA
jgi:hypothetical protein